MNGKVKFFNCHAGFGFIVPDEHPDEDLFCHVSNVLLPKNEYLQQDQVVTFDLRTDEQGRACATRVRRVPGQERVGQPAAVKRDEPEHADSVRPYIDIPGQPRQYLDRKTPEWSPEQSWSMPNPRG
jgi:cold shock protein